MELKMFQFIDDSIIYFKDIETHLDTLCEDIEGYFEEMLMEEDQGVLNINSRVKSISSLKEKIIRNNYYKKYSTVEEFFSNLSDLIGIRIECRFIEDENKIYKIIKTHFTEIDEEGYYYSSSKKNIKLKLSDKQPQEQKNGFKIFRIDGFYEYNDKKFNFELQIKSLVNIFWGEIEHKIIYKNNNYMLVDEFYKNIMGAIKKNLSMIDNQLLLIYDQVNKFNAINPTVRKAQLETVLSKIIYDIFSTQMKKSIGLIVDFKKSCDAIVKYIFRTNNAEDLEDYNETLLKTLSRLNAIGKDDMNFNSQIQFEREVEFKDEFCNTVGTAILKSINTDFQWNLFFRMLFQIELGNNSEDFESFIMYFKNIFLKNISFSKLNFLFNEEQSENIKNSIIKQLSICFIEIDSITFIYEENIEKINYEINDIIKDIFTNINTYEQWEDNKDIYLTLFNLKILSIFDYKIKTVKVKSFIERIKVSSTNNIQISESILKYIDKLELVTEISAKDALKLIKINNISEGIKKF